VTAAQRLPDRAHRIRVVRFGPARPWFEPGSVASIDVEVDVVATRSTRARLAIELLDLDQVVGQAERDVRLAPGRSRRRVEIALPAGARRGYGLRLTIAGSDGGTLARADASVEALDGWWQSPRHAAVTRFASSEATAAAVRALRDWHVTVVQDYDWMYRHYRYSPPPRDRLPGDAVVDTLGRRVSQAAVRAGIRAGHDAGIATLAYGSVYGAEREYVERHPDERVFDDTGRPISLGETFYINDIRTDRPWRRRLLSEYRAAVRRFGFDGVHMDTYGPPHVAFSADGEPLDFAALYPGLIVDGARAVAAARPGARVLFNCVEGFPLEAVGDSPAAAVYLELWPPDERYADLVRWIERARAAGRGRAIVIAAYLSCLRASGDDPAARPGAVEAVVMLTSLITTAGAYHHVIAEDNRVLVEGYYPEARQLRASEARELRAASVFGARYVHLLTAPDAVVETPDGIEVLAADGTPVPWSAKPEAAAVWARATRLADGSRVLQLVDLRAQPDDRWDALRSRVETATGWRLRWPGSGDVVAMSPWTDGGSAQSLRVEPDDSVRLPRFRRWVVLVDRSNLSRR
jgi:dextranase